MAVKSAVRHVNPLWGQVRKGTSLQLSPWKPSVPGVAAAHVDEVEDTPTKLPAADVSVAWLPHGKHTMMSSSYLFGYVVFVCLLGGFFGG